MADEPDNLILRLLRDIRAKQDTQDRKLDEHRDLLDTIGKRVEDLYKISTHTLGIAVNAHERYEELERKVESLANRVAQLETRQ